MRILFFANYPDQPIGYSKVAHALSHWLAAQAELHYFGIGNREEGRCRDRGIPCNANTHMIDVAALAQAQAKDTYGMDILLETVERLQPDVFLIYNDIIVTCRAFNALLPYRQTHPHTRFISYIDLVYPFEKFELVRHLDRNTDAILAFSECWRANLLEMGVPAQKIHVMPHGFSATLFWPLAATAAKAALGFAEDAFVILNANRNTYRKAQDIAIRAFIQFLVRENWDPRIYMFLHCALDTTSGYAILDLLEVEAVRAGVNVDLVKDRIKTFSPRNGGVQDSDMNLVYNAADVGLNTCMGEGFGLCQLEHAALGRPQIASRVGALADIFAEGGAILVEPRVWVRAANCQDEHSGDLGICAAEDFAEAMSTYFRDGQKREQDGLWGLRVLPERYNWSRILGGVLGPVLGLNALANRISQ